MESLQNCHYTSLNNKMPSQISMHKIAIKKPFSIIISLASKSELKVQAYAASREFSICISEVSGRVVPGWSSILSVVAVKEILPLEKGCYQLACKSLYHHLFMTASLAWHQHSAYPNSIIEAKASFIQGKRKGKRSRGFHSSFVVFNKRRTYSGIVAWI